MSADGFSAALGGGRRWRVVGSLLVAALAVCVLPGVAAAKKPPQKPKVATFNLYLGTDLPSLPGVLATPPAVSSGDRFADAVGFGLNDVNINNFDTRAKTIAKLIKKKKVDLVGLQEAALWKVQIPTDLTPLNPAAVRAGLVTYDYIDKLLEELNKKAKTGKQCKKKGIPKAKCFKGYRLVVSREALDTEFFGDFDNNCGTVKPGCGLGPAFDNVPDISMVGPTGTNGPPSFGGDPETNPGSDDTGIFAGEPSAAALGISAAHDWNGDNDANCDGVPDAASTAPPAEIDSGLNVTNSPPPPSPASCSVPLGPAAAPVDCPDTNAAGGFLEPTAPLGPNTTDNTSSCNVHGIDGDASLTMRDAILARKGTKTRKSRSGGFTAQATLPILGGAVVFNPNRGWVSTNAKVRGKNFRFVNTHLEAFDTGTVREDQASELVAAGGPATAKRTVLVGDLNSDPDSADPESPPAFLRLGGAGFRSLTGPAPTSGHGGSRAYASAAETGALITDPGNLATESRIDHILTNSSKIAGKKSRLLDRFANGLWTSDHAGVMVNLKFSKKKK